MHENIRYEKQHLFIIMFLTASSQFRWIKEKILGKKILH
jgi:hypothetical protein